MNLIKIGKFIAEQRKQKNLTQEQLAEKLGINNRTISRWENGINMPDASLYKKISVHTANTCCIFYCCTNGQKIWYACYNKLYCIRVVFPDICTWWRN